MRISFSKTQMAAAGAFSALSKNSLLDKNVAFIRKAVEDQTAFSASDNIVIDLNEQLASLAVQKFDQWGVAYTTDEKKKIDSEPLPAPNLQKSVDTSYKVPTLLEEKVNKVEPIKKALTIKAETIEKLIPRFNESISNAVNRRIGVFNNESIDFVKQAFAESVNEAFEAYKSNPTTFDLAPYMETWTEDFRVWNGYAREMFEILTGQKQTQKETENTQIEESYANKNTNKQNVFEVKNQPQKMLSAPKRNKIQKALALFKRSFDELFF